MRSALYTSAALAALMLQTRHADAQSEAGPGDLTAGLGPGSFPAGPLPLPGPPAAPVDVATDDDTVDAGDNGEEAADGPEAALLADGPGAAELPGEEDEPAPATEPGVELRAFKLPVIAKVVSGCGCTGNSCNFMPSAEGVRAESDKMDGGTKKSAKFTNMLWSWGQFLDHDFVATFVDANGGDFKIQIPGHELDVKRVNAQCAGKCREPRSVTTPQIDGGPIYSNLQRYTDEILREPNACKMRMSAGDLPPVTTNKITATGEGGSVTKHFFLAGDARVNEHSILTNMHTMWLREHNRLCDIVEADGKSGDEAFETVRAIVIGKMHEITLYEWLPALGITPKEVFEWKPVSRKLKTTSAISTEFFINYRWGHTGVPNSVGGFSIASIFDGEAFYDVQTAAGSADGAAADAKLAKLVQATATEAMADLDGHMADSLRNMLFGNADLASFNIFRARDIGLKSYSELCACYGVPHKPDLPTDPFVGTVQDTGSGGKAFGPLLHAIMVDQFHRIFFGAQGNWWEDSGAAFEYENDIRGTKMSDIISANTKANVGGNAFVLGGGGGSAARI